MSEAAQPELTEEQKTFIDGVKSAMNLAFITHLQVGGKAKQEPIKEAAEGERQFRIVHEDMDEQEIRGLFQKYAKEWIPHREEVTTGYLNILLGGEAAEAA